MKLQSDVVGALRTLAFRNPVPAQADGTRGRAEQVKSALIVGVILLLADGRRKVVTPG